MSSHASHNITLGGMNPVQFSIGTVQRLAVKLKPVSAELKTRFQPERLFLSHMRKVLGDVA